jgi:hypothetical protein
VQESVKDFDVGAIAKTFNGDFCFFFLHRLKYFIIIFLTLLHVVTIDHQTLPTWLTNPGMFERRLQKRFIQRLCTLGNIRSQEIASRIPLIKELEFRKVGVFFVASEMKKSPITSVASYLFFTPTDS